jgi:hypothetical protein
VQDNTLKLTAQLYPLADGDSRTVSLEIEKNGKWVAVAEGRIREDLYGLPTPDTKAWNVLFRCGNWDHSKDWK